LSPCIALLLFGLALSPVNRAELLTIERIYSDPPLEGKAPVQLKFSPDGSRVSFLRSKADDAEVLDLWEYHIASGESRLLVDSALLQPVEVELSDEEKARRERQRIRKRGIVSYQWADDGSALLFPLGGDIYYYSIADGHAKQLTDTPEFETDARLSPKNTYLSYIRDQNLFIKHIATGAETRLTTDGGGAISNGMAEFVAQEEMGRRTGYWWAPDESRLAYMRVDESSVDLITRSEIYADGIKMIEQRYPAAGTRNAAVKLGLVAVAGGETQWVAEADPDDSYLPRVAWLPDSRTLSYQWQNRNQRQLKLIFVDAATAEQTTILEERSDTWVNLDHGEHQGLYFLEDSPHFIWSSERDGFRHLYLYKRDGSLVRQLTRGEWVVAELVAVDTVGDRIYVTGNRETPLERHLYSAPLMGKGELQRITQRAGFHDISFAADASSYIDKFSTANSPGQVGLYHNTGKRITWLEENAVVAGHPFYPVAKDWIAPEFGSLPADDGTSLYYRLFKPRGVEQGKKHPVIVFLYGGPHAQLVTNSWQGGFASTYMYLQYLAQQGFVVFTLDNRGSANRGTRFENAIYEHMGGVEVADQVRGVEFLRTLPFVDAANIGVHGHSYGGYMTLMSMFMAPDAFKAGVSGAPVTDWLLYDTHYTERYMNLPRHNQAGYENSSVFPHATGLKGSLFIYHGMADDNVLFTNSTRLYKTLQDAAIPFEMMDYPGKKHGVRGRNTGIHLRHTVTRFFQRELNQK
jgi:dipeptidyl-peptidase-4